MAVLVLAVAGAILYPKQLESLFKFGLVILVVGVLILGVVLYFRKTRNTPKTITIEPPPNLKREARRAPSDFLDQVFAGRTTNQPKEVIAKPSEWSLELIKALDWKRFEELCAAYFEAKGRKTKVTDLGADGGIDVLLYGDSDPNKVLGVVQCKAWAHRPVGVKEIRELLGVMTDVGCPLGVYITTSEYTPDAKAFADGKKIKLMDAVQLLGLIKELPSESQSELLVLATAGDYTTPSCPSCGTKLVSRVVNRGQRKGQSFWGCSNYPRCRYTMRAKSA